MSQPPSANSSTADLLQNRNNQNAKLGSNPSDENLHVKYAAAIADPLRANQDGYVDLKRVNNQNENAPRLSRAVKLSDLGLDGISSTKEDDAKEEGRSGDDDRHSLLSNIRNIRDNIESMIPNGLSSVEAKPAFKAHSDHETTMPTKASSLNAEKKSHRKNLKKRKGKRKGGGSGDHDESGDGEDDTPTNKQGDSGGLNLNETNEHDGSPNSNSSKSNSHSPTNSPGQNSHPFTQPKLSDIVQGHNQVVNQNARNSTAAGRGTAVDNLLGGTVAAGLLGSEKSDLLPEDDEDILGDDIMMVEFSDIDSTSQTAPKRIGIEQAVEKVILSLLSPAIHGVQSIGIKSAARRAEDLLAQIGGPGGPPAEGGIVLDRTEQCVRQIISGSERAVLNRVLTDFFLDMIPFLGCPTILIKNTWTELRGIAIIASLYGHDLDSPRVQHEILLCLVPQSEHGNILKEGADFGGQSGSLLLTETAGKVARSMIKSAVEKATGMRLAADVVELATLLYNLYTPTMTKTTEDSTGFVHISNTPTATARNYFRPKLLHTISAVYIPFLLVGCISNQIVQVILWFYNFSFIFTFLLFVAIAGSAYYIVIYKWHEVLYRLETIPRVVITTLIFLVHAMMPTISAYSSCQMIMPLLFGSSGSVAATNHGIGNNTSNGNNGNLQFEFHNLAIFLLGCANLLHLLLKRLNFEQVLRPVLKKMDLSLWEKAAKVLPARIRPRSAENNVIDQMWESENQQNRVLRCIVNTLIALRKAFLGGCALVCFVYCILWLEYVSSWVLFKRPTDGMYLGSILYRYSIATASLVPSSSFERGSILTTETISSTSTATEIDSSSAAAAAVAAAARTNEEPTRTKEVVSSGGWFWSSGAPETASDIRKKQIEIELQKELTKEIARRMYEEKERVRIAKAEQVDNAWGIDVKADTGSTADTASTVDSNGVSDLEILPGLGVEGSEDGSDTVSSGTRGRRRRTSAGVVDADGTASAPSSSLTKTEIVTLDYETIKAKVEAEIQIKREQLLLQEEMREQKEIFEELERQKELEEGRRKAEATKAEELLQLQAEIQAEEANSRSVEFPEELLNPDSPFYHDSEKARDYFFRKQKQKHQQDKEDGYQREYVWNFLARSRLMFFAAISAWCQHHVSDVLRKREVLLKLLGAERLLANSLCLLLNGVAIISGHSSITSLTLADFLQQIAPPAIVCCGIVALRQRALFLGFTLAFFPALEAYVFPILDFGGSFLTGLLLGGVFFYLIGNEYLRVGRNMEASYAFRLAYLMPGEVSDRAVAFLDEIASKVKNRTVQYMAVTFLEKFLRFVFMRQ